MKFAWSAGKGKPYHHDTTVQKFLKETSLDLPFADRRPRVDLAGTSDFSPQKAG